MSVPGVSPIKFSASDPIDAHMGGTVTYDGRMPDRKHQVQIMLPRDLVKRVNAIAERRGHVRSQLFHGWAYAAALAATDGRADLLPPVRAWPLGDDPVQVGWSQAAVESKEWTKRIRTAGSSLRGVIHAASNAYIEADGDLLEMPGLFQPVPGGGQTDD